MFTIPGQERIRIKEGGRVCNLNWAEFLSRTKNRTSIKESTEMGAKSYRWCTQNALHNT